MKCGQVLLFSFVRSFVRSSAVLCLCDFEECKQIFVNIYDICEIFRVPETWTFLVNLWESEYVVFFANVVGNCIPFTIRTKINSKYSVRYKQKVETVYIYGVYIWHGSVKKFSFEIYAGIYIYKIPPPQYQCYFCEHNHMEY